MVKSVTQSSEGPCSRSARSLQNYNWSPKLFSTCIKCLPILVQSLYFQSANLLSTNGIRTVQTSQAYLSVLLWPWRSCCQEFRVTCRWTSMTLSKRFRCLKNIVIGVVVVVMVGGIAHLVAAFRVHLRNREEGISGAKKKERKARYITTVCLAPWHATAEPGRWGSAPHRTSRRPVKLEDLSGKMWQVISGLKMLQAGMHLHWSFCGFLTVPPQNLAMRSWRGDKSCYPKIWRPARPRNACWNRWTRCQADSTWEWRAPIGTSLHHSNHRMPLGAPPSPGATPPACSVHAWFVRWACQHKHNRHGIMAISTLVYNLIHRNASEAWKGTMPLLILAVALFLFNQSSTILTDLLPFAIPLL